MPYRAFARRNRRGQRVYCFEFTQDSPGPIVSDAANPLSPELLMDAIETFLSQFVLGALTKSFPNLSSDDQAKVTKGVNDFVTTAMDLATVYLALRASKTSATKT